MKRSLIIFAKEPKEGCVKTRLSEFLSEGQCVELYKAFLKDTIKLARAVDCEERILAYDAGSGEPEYIKKQAKGFTLYKQIGDDLGKRMHNAFKFAKSGKAAKTVIIGSDSPTLPASSINKAFETLDKNDVVLGPSRDGGYYAIGLKKPNEKFFRNIEWSTDKVMRETLKNIEKASKTISLLETWYDIDNKEGFTQLEKDLKNKSSKRAIWTRRFVKNGVKFGKRF